MELSKFTVNCAKSTQFANPCPELHEIHALRTNFSRFCIPSSKIAKIRAIRVTLIFHKICMIRPVGNNPGYSEFSEIHPVFINSHYHLTFVRQDPAPCLSESREFCKLKLQFMKYQLCMKFHLLCTH